MGIIDNKKKSDEELQRDGKKRQFRSVKSFYKNEDGSFNKTSVALSSAAVLLVGALGTYSVMNFETKNALMDDIIYGLTDEAAKEAVQEAFLTSINQYLEGDMTADELKENIAKMLNHYLNETDAFTLEQKTELDKTIREYLASLNVEELIANSDKSITAVQNELGRYMATNQKTIETLKSLIQAEIDGNMKYTQEQLTMLQELHDQLAKLEINHYASIEKQIDEAAQRFKHTTNEITTNSYSGIQVWEANKQYPINTYVIYNIGQDYEYGELNAVTDNMEDIRIYQNITGENTDVPPSQDSVNWKNQSLATAIQEVYNITVDKTTGGIEDYLQWLTDHKENSDGTVIHQYITYKDTIYQNITGEYDPTKTPDEDPENWRAISLLEAIEENLAKNLRDIQGDIDSYKQWLKNHKTDADGTVIDQYITYKNEVYQNITGEFDPDKTPDEDTVNWQKVSVFEAIEKNLNTMIRDLFADISAYTEWLENHKTNAGGDVLDQYVTFENHFYQNISGTYDETKTPDQDPENWKEVSMGEAIENIFNTYIAGTQGGILGWDKDAEYKIDDVVIYMNQFYVNKTGDYTDKNPSEDTANWQKMSMSQYTQYVQEATYNNLFNNIGEWDKNAEYKIDDVVIYRHKAYVNVTGKFTTDSPDHDTTNWKRMSTVELTAYYYNTYLSDTYGQIGDWAADKTFNLHEYVLYNGGIYRSLINGNTGVTPGTDDSVWEPVTTFGEIVNVYNTYLDGLYGGFNEWSATGEYKIDDLVTFEQKLYINVTGDFTKNNPSVDTKNWKVASLSTLANYFFEQTQLDIYDNVNEWSAAEKYSIDDYVTYRHKLYVNITGDYTDKTPADDTVNWAKVSLTEALKRTETQTKNTMYGDQEWSADKVYKIDDTVTYRSKFYINITGDYTDKNPAEDTTNWKELSQAEYTQYVYNTTLKNIFGGITEWSADKTYRIDEYVVFENKLYRNISDKNGTVSPDKDKENWAPVTITGSLVENYNTYLSGMYGGFNEWSATSEYKIDDYVMYQNHIYRNTTGEFTSISPDKDTTNWKKASAFGDVYSNYVTYLTGMYGTIAEWSANKSFALDSYAVFENKIYKNLTGENTDVSPDKDSTNWKVVSSFEEINSNFERYMNQTYGDVAEWAADASYKIDDCVMFQHKIYKNISGTNGTQSPDKDSTNWKSVSTFGEIVNNFNTYLNGLYGDTAEWSADATYKIDDYVMYQNHIYRNITGDFTSTSPDKDTVNWKKASVFGDIHDNYVTYINGMYGTITEWSADKKYGIDEYCVFENKLYRNISDKNGSVSPDKDKENWAPATIAGSLVENYNTYLSGMYGGFDEWDKDATYKIDDYVMYQNHIYRNTTGEFTSTSPDKDTANWKKVSAFGDIYNNYITYLTGMYGSIVEWSADKAFTIDSYAVFENKIYKNLTGKNTTTSPDKDSTNWKPVSSFEEINSNFERYMSQTYGDVAEWALGSIYSIDDYVMFQHKIYKNISGANGTQSPDKDTTNWKSVSTFGEIVNNFNTYLNGLYGDVAEWAAGTKYSIDDYVVYQHKIYRNITGDSTSISPDKDVTNWREASAFEEINANYQTFLDRLYDGVVDWVAGAAYKPNTYVMFENQIYKNVTGTNTSTSPDNDSVNWTPASIVSVIQNSYNTFLTTNGAKDYDAKDAHSDGEYVIYNNGLYKNVKNNAAAEGASAIPGVTKGDGKDKVWKAVTITGIIDANYQTFLNTVGADNYNNAKSYQARDYCIHNGQLYRALDTTTGSFNSSKWEKVTVTDSIESLIDNIDELRLKTENDLASVNEDLTKLINDNASLSADQRQKLLDKINNNQNSTQKGMNDLSKELKDIINSESTTNEKERAKLLSKINALDSATSAALTDLENRQSSALISTKSELKNLITNNKAATDKAISDNKAATDKAISDNKAATDADIEAVKNRVQKLEDKTTANDQDFQFGYSNGAYGYYIGDTFNPF